MSDDIRDELVALLPRLRRFAYAISGSLDDADDLVQAACERALRRSNQFEPGTRLDSWVFRIIQTIWIDRKRQAARRHHVTDQEVVEAVPEDARIEERTEAKEALALVRVAVADLPDEQRIVLSLVSIDGLSYKEAAATLDVPIGTVMSRLARARKKLAAVLEAEPNSLTAPAGAKP